MNFLAQWFHLYHHFQSLNHKKYTLQFPNQFWALPELEKDFMTASQLSIICLHLRYWLGLCIKTLVSYDAFHYIFSLFLLDCFAFLCYLQGQSQPWQIAAPVKAWSTRSYTNVRRTWGGRVTIYFPVKHVAQFLACTIYRWTQRYSLFCCSMRE